MKILNKQAIKFIGLMILAVSVSCEEEIETDLTNPIPPVLNFSLVKTNSENDFSAQVESFNQESLSFNWYDRDGQIQLTKSMSFEVLLSNGEVVDFGVYIRTQEENQDNLNLSEDGTEWAYGAVTEENNNIDSIEEVQVTINNNVLFCSDRCDEIQIIKIEKSIVSGQEHSYVEMEIDGLAFGWFDPEGQFMEIYEIKNGIFKAQFIHE